MVSLSELLQEANGKPKAIFMAGPAGSGKSTIIKELIPSYFTTLNIDDEYEKLLTTSGMGMAQKDFSPEELSQAAKFMSQAQKKTRVKFDLLSQELKDIIIDGTGAATIAIEPALITSPANDSAITHTSVQFTVALTSGVQEFTTGTSGLFSYEIDLEEVL